jgi:hypothetical protein
MIIILPISIIFAIIYGICRYKIAEGKLLKWINKNGYKLIKKEYQIFRRGPFTSTNMQFLYKAILNKNGIENEYWILVGHPIFGLLKDDIKVEKYEDYFE